MHRPYLIRILTLTLTALLFQWGLFADDKPERLNVVLILADDLGWKDLGSYGSTYFETPNIDRLASEGMRFTDAYAANPLCSPTRASILTGKNPDRIGITSPWCHKESVDQYMPTKSEPWHRVVLPYPQTYLPQQEYTLAEAMRDAGYRTVFVGKWHLGLEPHFPEKHGFEKNIGGMSVGGPPSYFSPYKNNRLEDGPKGEQLTDRLAKEAASYIDTHRDEAFFMCFWPYAVHGPYQAKAEYIRHFEKKRDPAGLQNCPTMAGMIKSLDDGVGTVLEALERNGLAEKTIVLFMGDNGPSKAVIKGEAVSTAKPLRNKKGSLYEGGVRVPLIVRWPGAVKPGVVSRTVATSTDLYPTVLEMLEVKPREGQVCDGVSLVPVLTESGGLDRKAIYCHYPSSAHAYKVPDQPGPSHHVAGSYVIVDGWKLIRRYETSHTHFPDRLELFHLAEDIGESTNLAEKYPEKVKDLDAMIDAYLEETGALVPKPNPAYDSKYDYLYP